MVANEYGVRPHLADRTLITVFTSDFAEPSEVFARVIDTMGSDHTVDVFRLRGGAYEALRMSPAAAVALVADIRAHNDGIRRVVNEGPGAFLHGGDLMANLVIHHKMMHTICSLSTVSRSSQTPHERPSDNAFK